MGVTSPSPYYLKKYLVALIQSLVLHWMWWSQVTCGRVDSLPHSPSRTVAINSWITGR